MATLAPGSVELFAGNFVPRTFDRCSGQTLSIGVYQALFSLIGTRFGGDGRTNFDLPKIPDLKSENGAGIEYLIEVDGMYGPGGGWMMGIGTGLIGEIVLFSGEFAPKGFLACNGAGYNVSEQSELFGIIGYQFGGSESVFNVPKIDSIPSEGSDGTVGVYIRANNEMGSTTPLLASIMLWGGQELPSNKAWKYCNGQELAIADNAALFSLIGNNYGEHDGKNFILPTVADNGGAKYIICTQGTYPARN